MKLDTFVNKLLHLFEITKVKTSKKVVYLTFDDGPEEGITEFILEELSKYRFSATFFCRGDNALKYPNLVDSIKKSGHSIGNHGYSHLHGFKTDANSYIKDLKKADDILSTRLLRPPYGVLKFSQFIRLYRKFKIIHWSTLSYDWNIEGFDVEESFASLVQNTKPGSIVLLHFCNKHSSNTRQILPLYCEWLYSNGWISEAL